MKYLVDSNIIIYHFNNEKLATVFLTENKNQCVISQITYIEVISFAFTQEQENDVKEFLESFKIIDVNREIAVQAIRNRKIKKIKMPDNIIASTAQVKNLILVTRNVSDFNFLDIKVLNIFEKI
ncbi:MAG: type II toxin-antitoxin system VapC family toxin [Methylovulum sp.]|nr:type II toxin-antitoxin system VapC family toxin [Methylovulum sp.]